ncbi:hypothetical protein ABBQ32_001639 [Trebouxia sp. C0010 RCD-2024]
MIHAAIASYGKQATLREIYKACQLHGRIAYKRSGGSRLITHNDHWKSQIRHALYTCDRFASMSMHLQGGRRPRPVDSVSSLQQVSPPNHQGPDQDRPGCCKCE